MEESILRCFDLVKGSRKVPIIELEDLLERKDNVSRKQFLDGYLPALFRMVYSIYNSYKLAFNDNYDFEDLFSDSIIELLKLYNQWEYDNSKNKYENFNGFTNYLRYRLLHLLRKTCYFDIGDNSFEKFYELLKQKEAYFRENGIDIGNDELVESMGWDKKFFSPLLDTLKYDDLKVKYDNIDTYINKDFDREVSAYIMKLIDDIPSERTKKILYEYFGMYYFDRRSIREIAGELKLTRQMVSLLKKQSMDLIKKDSELNEKYLKK